MCNIHLQFHTGKCGSTNSRISYGIILRWDWTLQGAHRGGHSSDLEECDTYTVSRPPPPTPSVTYCLYALTFTALHQKHFLFAVDYKEVRLSNGNTLICCFVLNDCLVIYMVHKCILNNTSVNVQKLHMQCCSIFFLKINNTFICALNWLKVTV